MIYFRIIKIGEKIWTLAPTEVKYIFHDSVLNSNFFTRYFDQFIQKIIFRCRKLFVGPAYLKLPIIKVYITILLCNFPHHLSWTNDNISVFNGGFGPESMRYCTRRVFFRVVSPGVGLVHYSAIKLKRKYLRDLKY